MVIIGKIARGCRAPMSVKALRAKAMAVWNEPFYRAFVRWEKQGIFDILWAILLTKWDELSGVDWHWQTADGCLGKARGVPGSGLAKRGVRSSASALTPVTVVSWASRIVSWYV